MKLKHYRIRLISADGLIKRLRFYSFPGPIIKRDTLLFDNVPVDFIFTEKHYRARTYEFRDVQQIGKSTVFIFKEVEQKSV